MATINPNGIPGLLPAGNALLNRDPEQLKRMEDDLISKVQKALEQAEISKRIFGIFSIDDLEGKQEKELCGGIAIGVGYLGASEVTRHEQLNVDRSRAAKSVEFSYMILLAIPADEYCEVRYDGLQLLTLLRQGILGSTIDGDTTNRTWDFVQEKPDIGESSRSMLYYSQVWRTVMQATGK